MKNLIIFLSVAMSSSISAQVTTVYNPITGENWMDRNLGATQIAASFDDVNAYGDLYQWGRGQSFYSRPLPHKKALPTIQLLQLPKQRLRV